MNGLDLYLYTMRTEIFFLFFYCYVYHKVSLKKLLLFFKFKRVDFNIFFLLNFLSNFFQISFKLKIEEENFWMKCFYVKNYPQTTPPLDFYSPETDRNLLRSSNDENVLKALQTQKLFVYFSHLYVDGVHFSSTFRCAYHSRYISKFSVATKLSTDRNFRLVNSDKRHFKFQE